MFGKSQQAKPRKQALNMLISRQAPTGSHILFRPGFCCTYTSHEHTSTALLSVGRCSSSCFAVDLLKLCSEKMMILQRKACTTGSLVRSRNPARCLRHASPESKDSAPVSGSTIFYGGEAYTEAQWKQALETGLVQQPVAGSEASKPAVPAATLSLADVMAFSGPVPEIANGRLAMLGFVSAVAAELASGEGVLKQWSEEPTGIAAAFLLFMAASIVPAVSGQARPDKIGPFTPQAEMLNGRAAMLGFAALLIIEAVKGSPLF